MRSKTSIFCALALTSGTLLAAETNAVEEAEAAETNAVEEAEAVDTAADARFARYQTILERLPFGPLPPNFDPDAPATRGGAGGGAAGGALDPAAAEALRSKEEQQIIASVRVSALNVTPSGKIAVGFTDSSRQPAGNYYLRVGESRDGWTVKDADAHEMKVTLEKDGIEATLALGEGSGDGKGGAKRGAPPPNARSHSAASAPAHLLGGARPPVAPGGNAITALRAKRKQQDAEEQQRKAIAAANAEAERQEKAKREAEAAAREAEREAERAAEREQQREQLKAIQEELRRSREEREQRAAEQAQNAANENAEGGGEDSP